MEVSGNTTTEVLIVCLVWTGSVLVLGWLDFDCWDVLGSGNCNKNIYKKWFQQRQEALCALYTER